MEECERCGNCCPTTCEYLVIEEVSPRLTRCEVHDDDRHKGLLCEADPARYYSSGIACRAILTVLQEYPPVTTNPNGQIVLRESK